MFDHMLGSRRYETEDAARYGYPLIFDGTGTAYTNKGRVLKSKQNYLDCEGDERQGVEANKKPTVAERMEQAYERTPSVRWPSSRPPSSTA